MQEAPELHWRWRGEAGPPVDRDLSNTIVVLAILLTGLLLFSTLLLAYDGYVLRRLTGGRSVTLAGMVLVATEVALLFRASPRLFSGDVRLWTLTLPSALLWALGAIVTATQPLLTETALIPEADRVWARGMVSGSAPMHTAALIGGAMLLPLLIVGVVAIAEGARRRRWALARRGGWLSLSGVLGLLAIRWGWLASLGARMSLEPSLREGDSDEIFVTLEAARQSTMLATGLVLALIVGGLLVAYRRQAALPMTPDGLPSIAMLVAPLVAWAVLTSSSTVQASYEQLRRAHLDRRPAPLFGDEVLAQLRETSRWRQERTRGPHTLMTVQTDEDAAAFAEKAFMRGRAEILVAVDDIAEDQLARMRRTHVVPRLPRLVTFDVPLHRGTAGSFPDLVLVFNSQGLKAPGDEPTADVEALIDEVEATRGDAGRIVVVPVAGRVGALIAELQRRGAAPGSPSWSIGRAMALLEEPCGCFIGPSPGNDPDTYLDARLCLDGGELRGEVRWLSRNSGSNTRRVEGNVEGNAWTLHDVEVSASRARDGWRFCKIDRYTLAQDDSLHLVGAYVSEACDDRATLDLAPVECPDDVAASTR